MANGIGHRQHGEAEGESDSDETDTERGKGGREDGAATAAKDEPEGTKELGNTTT